MMNTPEAISGTSLTDNSHLNRRVIVWTTLVGGLMSSLVKWGSEINMPPRPPGELSPPGANIDAWFGRFGFDQHTLDYVYQGHSVLGAVTLYHWLFSFACAFIYVFIAYYWNKIRLWYGVFFGLLITLLTHGFIVPLLGWRNPSYANGAVGWLWNLNGYEFWSEIIGHIYWGVSIEICMIAVLAHFGKPIYGPWANAMAKPVYQGHDE